MKKINISLFLALNIGLISAQNNVGVGTITPNSQAILEVTSNDKGVLISRLTTTARNTLGTALTATEDGMLVYDKNLTAFYFWDGPNLQWVQVGSETGDQWGEQVVQTSGVNISGDGTTGNPIIVTDGDTDATNEIELPTTATTGQVLAWNGTSWVAQNAGSGSDNCGNDVVNTTGANISGDGTIGNPLSVTDGDSNPTNEIQNLSVGSGNSNSSIIKISGGTGITIKVAGDLTITETGNVITIGGGIPAGAIIAFNLATCPTGYAPANGTGGMPDLRGEFVRGLDNGRGVDPGRTLASSQTESLKSHNHSVNPPATTSNSTGNHSHSVNPPVTSTSTNGNHSHTHNDNSVEQPYTSSYSVQLGGGATRYNNVRTTSTAGNHLYSIDIAPFNSNTTSNHNHSTDIPQFNSRSTGVAETKPRNVALLYCVKQ